MPIGTVKFFNDQKGYGFIAPEDGGNDAFVHITAVERAGMRTLQKDQRVSDAAGGRPARQDERRQPSVRVTLANSLRPREDLRPAPPRAGRAEGARS